MSIDIVPPVAHRHISRFINVDGIRTHYIEVGEGPNLVMLHGGEFGANAELCWEYLIPLLAPHFRIVAPDWLGFGQTAKVYDFENRRARMCWHMARFVEVMAIDKAHFVGNSMGGTLLLQMAAEKPCRLPIDRLISISGGGFLPDNAHRQSLLDYDGTEESMARVLEAIFDNPVWYSDPAYIKRRHEISIAPGAWESVAAARFRSPSDPLRSEFGNADTTPYGNIGAPVLVIAGARDKLRLPGYANDMIRHMPNPKLALFEDGGHCPNIEQPEETAAVMLKFLLDQA
ncbi:alpha/beta hydrolase family protein (plasmid) [Rhizobium phaseoli]|uniref:alpha/beta fold hydrolase n=1 Tax=Rhizobium phaseoli TaxID=396 RepID=UPI0007EB7AD6|nr:alpha/beta hydrolase [Rhizobium phaseoli]ANL51057.1 alpha/beta hydrolase family protein [Rhizobium phaseoli]